MTRPRGQRGEGALATTYAIERVALSLFVERGFSAVTAEQIAEAAGVSVRTFYRHFPEGKEGVVLLETRRGNDLFMEALQRRPPQEPAMDAVRNAALESIRILDDPPPPNASFGFREAQEVYNQINADNTTLIARLIGERVLSLEPLVALVALRMSLDPNTDIRPRLLVHAVNAAITVSFFTSQANPAIDRRAALDDALNVLAEGMAAGGAASAAHASPRDVS